MGEFRLQPSLFPPVLSMSVSILVLLWPLPPPPPPQAVQREGTLGHRPAPFPVSPSSHAPARGPGLVAVFDYHRKKGYADLYSLHSWCGIVISVLYFVQVSPLSPAARGWRQ